MIMYVWDFPLNILNILLFAPIIFLLTFMVLFIIETSGCGWSLTLGLSGAVGRHLLSVKKLRTYPEDPHSYTLTSDAEGLGHYSVLKWINCSKQRKGSKTNTSVELTEGTTVIQNIGGEIYIAETPIIQVMKQIKLVWILCIIFSPSCTDLQFFTAPEGKRKH